MSAGLPPPRPACSNPTAIARLTAPPFKRSGATRVRALAACVGLLAALAFGSTAHAATLDEVVLKNGRRYVGEVVASTPTSVVLSIDGGTVEFPRSMIASPPYLGVPADEEAAPGETPAAAAEPVADVPPHPLPDVPTALRRLAGFSWATELRQMPVQVSDQGRWQFLPRLSFWVADFFELAFFGDPARPSAIEVSLHHPAPTAWEQKKLLLEYVLSLVPGLALDSRFDDLDVGGDQFALGDLWFEVTGADSERTPGRWAVLLLHQVSLRDARASYDELRAISEPVAEAAIDPNRPRSWQRGTWLPEQLAWMRNAPGAEPAATPRADAAGAPSTFTSIGERVYLRAFRREGGRYVPAKIDWTREFARSDKPPR